MAVSTTTFRERIRNTVTAPVLTFGVAVALFLGSFFLYFLVSEINWRLTIEGEKNAQLLHEKVKEEVGLLEELSAKPAIVNALVTGTLNRGEIEKDFYLLEPIISKPVIVDSLGKIVFSLSERFPLDLLDANNHRISDAGKSTVLYSEEAKRFFVGVPVVYYNTPQGAVYAEIDIKSLLSKLNASQQSSHFTLKFGDESITKGSSSVFWNKNFTSMDDISDYYSSEFAFVTFSNDSRFQNAIQSIVLGLVLILIISYFLSNYIANMVGVKISIPVYKLVQRVNEKGTGNTVSCFPLGTNDELDDLAKSFDRVSNDLLASNENLEEKILTRTEELSESLKATEQALKSRSQFLANMSHEIRTPMNGILGMVQILREEKLSSDHMKMLDIIYGSADSLLHILNDILDHSKIDNDKVILEKIEFSLLELVRRISALFQASADAKGVQLESEVLGDVSCQIITDPTRVQQIVSNLVSNAIKFTETGKIKIIAQIQHIQAEAILRIDVIDSGLGIAPENLSDIFKLFIQADDSTTRKFGGTGLGLSISRKLALLLGGDITVQSELGQGSTFSMSVPISIGKPKKEPVRNAEPSNIQIPSYHVLVAEDNPINQEYIKRVLEHLEISFEITSNGQKCIEAFRAKNGEFDLIFMDCQMPILDGFEATKQLLVDPAYRGQAVIALTANVMEGIKNRCYEAGMTHFISKPFTRKQITQLLEDIHKSVS